MKYIFKAIEEGSARAIYILGNFYYNGVFGIKENRVEGTRLIKIAADLGEEHAIEYHSKMEKKVEADYINCDDDKPKLMDIGIFNSLNNSCKQLVLNAEKGDQLALTKVFMGFFNGINYIFHWIVILVNVN